MSRTLGNVLEDLSFGALSNLSIGDSGSGSIPESHRAKIVHHINRGLSKLHSRFVIYQRELYIRLVEGQSLYPLIKEAGLNYINADPSNLEAQYILDSKESPFSADVIRILEAWKVDPCDPEKLIEISINDSGADDSIFTPATDVVQILSGKAGDIYQLMYQADHYQLLDDDDGQIIYLPEYLYEALEHYVAYKVFSSMNGEEHRGRAMEHLMHYQNVLQTSVDLDLIREVSVTSHTKLEERGFK